jgi:hypothetical protein
MIPLPIRVNQNVIARDASVTLDIAQETESENSEVRGDELDHKVDA